MVEMLQMEKIERILMERIHHHICIYSPKEEFDSCIIDCFDTHKHAIMHYLYAKE
jgi:hypothetical protein